MNGYMNINVIATVISLANLLICQRHSRRWHFSLNRPEGSGESGSCFRGQTYFKIDIFTCKCKYFYAVVDLQNIKDKFGWVKYW